MSSVHERSCQKPACSSRSRLSRLVFSLFVKTLPGMDSNIIPRQLPQDDGSPFSGSFTRCPFFQSSGTFSSSQILLKSGCNMSVEVWMSTFRASGGMPSGPAAFPDLSDLMALAISALLGGLVLTSRSSAGGGTSGGAGGAGLLSVYLKCSAHLALCSSSPNRLFPFSSLTGRLGLLFLPERVMLIS